MNQSMMTAPLKFLELPWLAQEEIISKTNILDLIKFTLASPRLFTIVKTANRRVEMIEFWFQDEIESFIQLCEEKNKAEFEITFPDPEDLESAREEICKGKQYADVFKKFTIHGVTVFLSSTQENPMAPHSKKIVVDFIEPTRDQQKRAMRMFTEHIWTLFKYKGHSLCYHSNDRINDCWVFGFTKQFSYMAVDNEFSDNTMTVRDIQWLLETVKCDDLFFRPPVRQDRAYLRPLTTKYITMEHAEWMSLESLLNSESVSIFVFKDSLRDAELNWIIHAWMNGGLAKLQSFVMNFQAPLVHSRNIVFGRVSHAPADTANRPAYFNDSFTEKWTRNDDAVDIKTNDGKLTATVTMGPMHGVRGFGMFIWHETYNLKKDD